jgi:hypothetical protein
MTSHAHKLAARTNADPTVRPQYAPRERTAETMVERASICMALHAMQVAGTVMVLAALTGLSGYRSEWVGVNWAAWLGAALTCSWWPWLRAACST